MYDRTGPRVLQCVLEVANPLIRVEAAVSHLDTISLSFFFSSQKQATVLASSTSQCLTASEDATHFVWIQVFFTLQREFVWREKVQAVFVTRTRVCVFVCLCVCVASVGCVPRARPRDPAPVTPSPLSPPRASRALCALRAGTKCLFICIHVYMLVCACVLCQKVLCALS
jgi:hypothetical protein